MQNSKKVSTFALQKRRSPSVKRVQKDFLLIIAKIAQLVEHNLAKVGVAGSSPVFRSNIPSYFLTESLSFWWQMLPRCYRIYVRMAELVDALL